jgi:hypothetical protein
VANSNGSGHETVGGQRIDWYSAESADIDRSMVNSLDAREATVTRGVVNRLQSEEADIAHSAIGTASFDRGTIRESNAGVIVGRSVACDEVRVGILASPVVRGEVHTWLDLRAAVAIGVGFALGKVVIGAIGALLRRATR